MIVYDDEHRAWWERSKRAVPENLGHDASRVHHVPPTSRRSATACSTRDSCASSAACCTFSLLLPREQTHVGAEAGIGALVRIEKAIDVRGKPFM